MTDLRYGIVLRDPISNESLGLNISSTRPLAFQSANPMAARTVTDKSWSAMNEYSVEMQRGSPHGLGLEFWDKQSPNRHFTSQGIDSRIQDQWTLNPAVTLGVAGTSSFAYNPILPSADWWLTPGTAQSAYAMSFRVASSFTLTQLALYCGAQTGQADISVRIETDSAGAPSGTLVAAGAHATKQVGTTMSWVTFSLAGNAALQTGITYWLVIVASQASYLRACKTDSYASGTSLVKDAGGNWRSTGSYGVLPYGHQAYGQAGDIYFLLLDEAELAGTVTDFCYWPHDDHGGMFCSGGNCVYRYNEAVGIWELSKNCDKPVTDLCVFADALWAACGDTAYKLAGATGTWSEVSAAAAKYFYVWQGYVYRALEEQDAIKVYWSADAFTWYGPWFVGGEDRGETLSAIAGYADEVYISTSHGLYALGPDVVFLAKQVADWSTQQSPTNGIGMSTWLQGGGIYFPLGGAILKYDGYSLTPVGPDKDAGLQEERAGRVRYSLGLVNWLLVALDAGAGISGIYAHGGLGWHELVTVPQRGVPCTALGYDPSRSPQRLWFGFGSKTGYVVLPDIGDNPYHYRTLGLRYADNGYFITPWISGDLLMMDKDWWDVGIQADIPPGGLINAQYEVDHSGIWHDLGTVGLGAQAKLPFPWDPALSSEPTVAAISPDRYTLTLSDISALGAGSWIRVKDETREIVSAVGNQVTVLFPWHSDVKVGDPVYASKAVGRELRLRFSLSTDNTSLTPRMLAWWLDYMPMLTDYWQASFEAMITDKVELASGQILHQDAKKAAQLLRSFARRRTPVVLVDMRGDEHLMKINRISERQTRREEAGAHREQPVESLFTLSLVEVT